MHGLIEFTILSFWSLFVIVDPLTIVPAFLTMTAHDSQESRIRTAFLACAVAFTVLLIFSIAGQKVLDVFGIGMPAFQIAGGIVLLKIALDMLQARSTAIKETPEEQAEGANKVDIAVTPLAVPMLAGPGALTTVVLISGQVADGMHHLILALNLAVVCLLTFVVLRIAVLKPAIFSTITIKIMTRLMGLLLASIAVQFILNGWRAAFGG